MEMLLCFILVFAAGLFCGMSLRPKTRAATPAKTKRDDDMYRL